MSNPFEKYNIVLKDGAPHVADTNVSVSQILDAFTQPFSNIKDVCDTFNGCFTHKQLRDVLKFTRDMMDMMIVEARDIEKITQKQKIVKRFVDDLEVLVEKDKNVSIILHSYALLEDYIRIHDIDPEEVDEFLELAMEERNERIR